MGQACQGASAQVQPTPTNASIADVPRVEVAGTAPNALEVPGSSELRPRPGLIALH
jgi:hypothetical protein